jgi:2-phospho-L-lactate guanylyltransferase
MPLSFGDDSFLPHLAAARAIGIEPTIVKLPGIGLDIDQPSDIQGLLRAEPRMATRAVRLLEAFAPVPRYEIYRS